MSTATRSSSSPRNSVLRKSLNVPPRSLKAEFAAASWLIPADSEYHRSYRSYPPQCIAPAGDLSLSLRRVQCRLETSLGPMQRCDVLERSVNAAAEPLQTPRAARPGLE